MAGPMQGVIDAVLAYREAVRGFYGDLQAPGQSEPGRARQEYATLCNRLTTATPTVFSNATLGGRGGIGDEWRVTIHEQARLARLIAYELIELAGLAERYAPISRLTDEQRAGRVIDW